MHKNTVTVRAQTPMVEKRLERLFENLDEITLCEPRHGTNRRYFHRYKEPLTIKTVQDGVTNEKMYTLSVNQPDNKIADSVALAFEHNILEHCGLKIAYWEWTSKHAVIDMKSRPSFSL